MPRKRGIIETDRLILRPLYDTDAEDLYTIGSDEQTAYWAGMYRYDADFGDDHPGISAITTHLS